MATLRDTKNGSTRQVPLTKKATRVLTELDKNSNYVFQTSDYALRHGWDRLIKRAGISGLRFHDLRREALSRLFEKGLRFLKLQLYQVTAIFVCWPFIQR